VARIELDDTIDESESYYFSRPNGKLEFIDSGCAVLNSTLGGGWPLTRIANIVGDESTGKTLLAIEACANFARQFSQGEIFYREAESAFDEAYAGALGMPLDRVKFIEPDKFVTIEDFYEDLCDAVEYTAKRNSAGLYIVDSLDALSDKAELKTGFDEGTYGTAKAKQMARLLRLVKQEVAKARMCLIIISQTRDKISEGFAARFGKKKTRSGGTALNFYASQCLWLSPMDHVRETIEGVKEDVGIRIKAKCEKNKIALPYRQCEFVIRFGQGIDSLTSSLDWLENYNKWGEVIDVTRKTYIGRVNAMSDKDYWEEARRIDKAVTELWAQREEKVLAKTRHKYQE